VAYDFRVYFGNKRHEDGAGRAQVIDQVSFVLLAESCFIHRTNRR
jgi:hypothetical protein